MKYFALLIGCVLAVNVSAQHVCDEQLKQKALEATVELIDNGQITKIKKLAKGLE